MTIDPTAPDREARSAAGETARPAGLAAPTAPRGNQEAERLAQIVESSDDAIISTTLDGIVTTWNAGAERLYGFTAAEMLGRRGGATTPSERRTELEAILVRVARGERVQNYETVRLRKDGSAVDVSVSIAPLRDTDGTVVGSAAIVRDVTDRKQAQAERERLAAHVRLLMESTDEGLYGIDGEGRCTWINRAGAAMLGYLPDEMVGREVHDLVHHRRADGTPYPVAECPILRTCDEGKGCRVEEEVFWRRDGTAVPVEYSAYPVRDEQGAPSGAVVAFWDCSARRLAEQALRAAVTELEHFAYTVSHDLKAPLVSIQGFTSLLADEYGAVLAGGNGALYLERIRRNADRLFALITDVLAFSSLGRVDEPMATVDLGALLADVEAALGPHTASAVVAATPLPAVLTQPTALRQVLENLIGNGLKYGGAAGKASRVEVGADETATHWRLWVRDDGPGIPREEHEKVFRLFARLPDARARDPAGTGVGLATVKRAVERMGGAVWIESDPTAGPGTTVWVTLPKTVATDGRS